MAGYTQKSLAKAADMSVNSLNAKINGRAEFTIDEVDVLCDLLHIETPDEKVEIFLVKSSQKWDGVAGDTA